ncbi:hypothetical protein SARC_09838, partial [Sphaeroforma arctica JP610]
AQRREFGDLVTYQRALKLSGGRVEVETLLQPALSVEYTVEATFQPSASYSDACSSAVSGFTETIHISIQERIPDLTLNVSPGGTKFLVQMLTMTLIYALEMALDPSVSIDEAPFVSREVYEWKRGPMIQRQDFDNKTLCIIQVGAHDLAFRSMLATFEYMTKALGLIHAMAINFPHSTFVVQSTASYGIPKSRGIHTIRYKAEGSRHFRKETNTG